MGYFDCLFFPSKKIQIQSWSGARGRFKGEVSRDTVAVTVSSKRIVAEVESNEHFPSSTLNNSHFIDRA